LLQADERLALDRRERYWDALERHHEACGGTIVQRLGDGSMSMFPSSLAAVEAAVAVQQELAPEDVPVRIGVHSGERGRRTGAADGRCRQRRCADRVVRPTRRRLVVGRGVRADQEPKRCRLPCRWVGSGSRTSGARSNCLPCRRRLGGTRRESARGKGRALREPAEQSPHSDGAARWPFSCERSGWSRSPVPAGSERRAC
jgi:hypothetical protein